MFYMKQNVHTQMRVYQLFDNITCIAFIMYLSAHSNDEIARVCAFTMITRMIVRGKAN